MFIDLTLFEYLKDLEELYKSESNIPIGGSLTVANVIYAYRLCIQARKGRE
jgi:hypothetical protein